MQKSHICELRKKVNEVPIKKGCFTRLKQYLKSLIVVSERYHLCRRYFKSSASIEAERRRHLESRHWYIIHPLSIVKITWEYFMMIVLFLLLLLIPIDVAFYHLHSIKNISAFPNLVASLNLICIIDIIGNFITGYIDNKAKEIVRNPKSIAKRYLYSYFLIDFLSSFPFDYVCNIARVHLHFKVGAWDAFEMLPLLKIFRIFRVNSCVKLTGDWFDVSSHRMRYVQLFLNAFIYVHWTACLHYSIPFFFMERKPEGSTDTASWIKVNGIDKMPIYEKYIQCVFRIISLALGLGYGQRSERNNSDQLMSILSMMTGCLMYLFCFIVILESTSESKASTTKYEMIKNQIKEYMRHKKLPESLQQQILMYYEYRFQKAYFREDAIMNTLSIPLREEMMLNACKGLLKNTPFFTSMPSDIIRQLASTMQLEIFLPNDVIMKAGTKGSEMFFLASGTVALLTITGREMCHLEDGCFFGEVALINEEERRAYSILALEFCEVYSLTRFEFRKVYNSNRQHFAEFERIALERMQRIILAQAQQDKDLFNKLMRPVRTSKRTS